MTDIMLIFGLAPILLVIDFYLIWHNIVSITVIVEDWKTRDERKRWEDYMLKREIMRIAERKQKERASGDREKREGKRQGADDQGGPASPKVSFFICNQVKGSGAGDEIPADELVRSDHINLVRVTAAADLVDLRLRHFLEQTGSLQIVDRVNDQETGNLFSNDPQTVDASNDIVH